ncbi:hypothetical protein MED297_08121 [Reinekea sp. MED297]|uniref:Uncharacterized protein n=1 Tax=Reinekea blandensis MED297 TaxID=314283 RepID=A4BCV7_9GAMM|nr:hypothetical protein MED297_08121 [Reinekea sp. MED297] [Reinekea blandensis MED297]
MSSTPTLNKPKTEKNDGERPFD